MSKNIEYEDEDLDDIIEEAPDTMADVAVSGLNRIDWFLLFIVALSFLFVISDVYINQLLVKIPDAVKHNEPTAWGSLIQMVSQLLLILGATAVKTYW